MPRTQLLKQTLESLVEGKKFSTLKDVIVTMNPSDIAYLLSDVSEKTLLLLFRLLPKELAAETFVEMESDRQEMLVAGFSDSELRDVVNELFIDDAVDLIEEMPANLVTRILKQTDNQMRVEINQLLKFPPDSAGSIMTTEYVSLDKNMTAGRAIEEIRREGIDKETINICYVTDSSSHLLGIVSIRHLILASPDELIENLMDENVIAAGIADDKEQVAQMFSKYSFLVLPVCDGENKIVGIVTVDDALEVMQDEATEDIEKMAAITPSDKPYVRTSVFELWKHRIPWLLILMISATLTGMIIKSFEAALSACVILTAYIPMLMDTGGNCGSQASVTVIRALSLQELEFKDIFRVIWKELRVALLCGLTLSVCNFAKLMLFDRLEMSAALTICATLLLTVTVAKIVGCTLPMLAKKIGFDPAVMASPFITTIVDALSLLVYFRMAAVFLGI